MEVFARRFNHVVLVRIEEHTGSVILVTHAKLPPPRSRNDESGGCEKTEVVVAVYSNAGSHEFTVSIEVKILIIENPLPLKRGMIPKRSEVITDSIVRPHVITTSQKGIVNGSGVTRSANPTGKSVIAVLDTVESTRRGGEATN